MSDEEYNLYATRKSLMIPVTIETQSLEMELDTGADVSLISKQKLTLDSLSMYRSKSREPR